MEGDTETTIVLRERIESLETAVKSLEKKLDAILKEMKTFNETNAH
jgi:archaellum component FlaC